MHLAMTMPSTMVESPGSVRMMSAAARAASVAMMRVYVCVCVREKERERERESVRKRERDREREVKLSCDYQRRGSYRKHNKKTNEKKKI